MESRQLIVQLKDKQYPILIGHDLSVAIDQKQAELKKDKRSFAIITDENCAQLIPRFFKNDFDDVPILVLPAGEPTKSVSYFEEALRFLAENKIDRKSCLFVIGGGVIGDLGGFVAASFLRGIDFYAFPTTLLAMVDSSVGGKTGINLPEGKNLVGAFHQPCGVFADTQLLQTLPAREFAAGMAEVIKYGLLGDAALFYQLSEAEALTPGHPELINVIHRCCQLKAEIVQADEKETASSGGRALLNLGHTFAHAIENVAGYGDYLHGEAVSVGLVLAARLSQTWGYLDDATVELIVDALKKYQLPVSLKSSLSTEALIESMRHDKKTQSGKTRFIILRKIGEAVTTEAVDPKIALKVLNADAL